MPLHGKINLEQRGGFLSDPDDDFGKHLNPDVRDIARVVRAKPGLTVLCGEPAMGKTIALEAFLATERGHQAPNTQEIALRFRSIPNDRVFERQTIESPAWVSWRAGTGQMTLVVDGVDEGLQKIAGFVDYLAGLLKSEPVTRLRVILACRSAEWPTAEGAELAALWPASNEPESPQSVVWELCPLRRVDVELAAKASGFDARQFVQAIHQQQASSLANRPMTLRMLLREFQGGSRFSGTHRDLYLAHCRFLCGEVDGSRLGRLRQEDMEERVYQVAQRIAALMLLCNRSAVYSGPKSGAQPGDLTIAEIVGGPAKGPINRALVETTLRTPLFWPKSDGRVHFFHQTFAECLACDYLAGRPFAQLRPLLCSQDRYGEHVEPQLTELAAWIAAALPKLFQHLLIHDPETLLRSDLARLPENNKAELVCAVLERAKAEQLFDGHEDRRFYLALDHPGLLRILRPYIENRRLNIVVRRMAIQIGASCQRRDLLPILLDRLTDARDSVIHRDAAAALDDVTTRSSAHRLLPYATGRRRLQGGANTNFWLVVTLIKQGVWRLGDAMPYIDACLRDNRDTTGYVLAGYATAADADALLARTLVWPDCFDSLSRYHALVVQACDLGLARMHEPVIRTLLVRVWLHARRKHDDLPHAKGKPTLHSVLAKDALLRRQFIGEAFRIGGRNNLDVYHLREIADVAEDFLWLLESISRAPERRIRRGIATLAAALYQFDVHAKHWDLLLRRRDEVPELGQAFAWLRAWRLDEESAIKSKQHYDEKREWGKKLRDRKERVRDAETVWQEAFAGLAKRTSDAWSVAAHNFFYGKDESPDAGTSIERHNLETSPGWKHFGAQEQEEIRDAARHYLLHQPGDPYLRKGQLTDFAIYAFRALFLLRAEIETNSALTAAVRRHWVPVLLVEYHRLDAGLATTIPLAYRLAPAQVYRSFEAVLTRRLRKSNYVLELPHFAPCWNGRFTRRLLKFCQRRLLPGDFTESVFRFLVPIDRDAALTLGMHQFQKDKLPAKDKVRIGALIFSHGLLEVWPELWPILKSRPGLAKSIVLSAAHDRAGGRWPDRADATHKIAQVYLLLRRLFPPAQDEPTPGGYFTPTLRMNAVRFRDDLLRQLAAIGTAESCLLLEGIAARLPASERIWVRWILREGILGMRRQAWRAPATDVINELVANADGRLLRTEDDLMTVVLESLVRLEDNLQRRANSPIDEYWIPRKLDGKKKAFAPIGEVAAAKKLTTWLEQDLDKRRGITVQREVSIQWNQRTDIEVRAVAVNDDQVRPLEITIEVKGCWHRAVNKSLASQLREGYLKKAGRTHGIYLVLWTDCPSWNDPADTRRNRLPARSVEQARAALVQQEKAAVPTAGGYVLEPFVLDLTI